MPFLVINPYAQLYLMPVSHRAYGLYGQARTVNAYGHPKTRGPAAVSSFVESHRCLSFEC